MSRPHPIEPLPALLALSIGLALAAPAAAVESRADYTDPKYWTLCRNIDALPPFPMRIQAPPDVKPGEVVLEADTFDVARSGETVFEGDVQMLRNNEWLTTPRLDYNHKDQSWRAGQGIRYQDENLRLVAERGEGFPERELHRLEDVTYQLTALRGNGSADSAELDHGLGWLEHASFTTCDPGYTQWELRAKRIRIDREKGFGTAWGSTIRIGGVPILYFPYFQFPIDDRRKSGFLYPAFSQGGRSGTEFYIPYYLNLAPNYDATVSARIMSERGVMLGGEFRYLFNNHHGQITGQWLPNDQDDERERDRGELEYTHFSHLSQTWNANVDLNLVSDDRYFEDFGDSIDTAATRLLLNRVMLSGRGRYWSSEIAVEGWDLVDPLISDDAEPFRRLPRVDFRWEQPLLPWVTGGLQTQGVVFGHDTLDAGNRFDFKPYVLAPLEGSAWFLQPQIAYRYTAYNLDTSLARDDDDTPNRGVPIYSVDGGLFFERDTEMFGRRWLQTLEPRAYYLHVPFRNQRDIPLFDTRELTFGYAQLFRDNRFSGADRQGDANQITVAATTRLIDPENGREYGSLTLGQARFLDSPDVTLDGSEPRKRDASPLVAEVDVRISDRLSVGSVEHWDADIGRSDLTAVRAQYRFRGDGVANVSYRFRRSELEQLDSSVVYPLSPSWRLIGRWNYSLRDDATVEGLGGFEWQSCCMAVRLLGRNFVRNREGEKSNQIYLEVELKGLGNLGRNTADLLERAILGYSR